VFAVHVIWLIGAVEELINLEVGKEAKLARVNM